MNKNNLGNSPLQTQDRIVIERKGVPAEVSLEKMRTFMNGTEILNATSSEIDFSDSLIFNITLTANTTFTFVNASPGVYIFKLNQGGSGSYTVTWPLTVKWAGGSAPTLTTAVGSWDIITLIFDGTYFSATSTLNFTV